MTTIHQQFPDFPADGVPACLTATGWSDGLAWHNDAMPFVFHDASGVGVWLNWPGSDLPHDPRFNVVALEWVAGMGWQHGISGDLDLFQTDDVATLERSLPAFVVPRAIGQAFADLIESRYSDEEIAAVRSRNATPDYAAACATHDFSDANEIMAEAFANIMGREVALNDDTPEGEAAAQTDCELWNQAWDIAKRERLTGTAWLDESRAPMIAAAEAFPLPDRFLATPLEGMAQTRFTDRTTGRTHDVALYATGAARQLLAGLFG